MWRWFEFVVVAGFLKVRRRRRWWRGWLVSFLWRKGERFLRRRGEMVLRRRGVIFLRRRGEMFLRRRWEIFLRRRGQRDWRRVPPGNQLKRIGAATWNMVYQVATNVFLARNQFRRPRESSGVN